MSDRVFTISEAIAYLNKYCLGHREVRLRTMQYWMRKGYIPYPKRYWDNGATRAHYTQSEVDAILAFMWQRVMPIRWKHRHPGQVQGSNP